jgi:hypothetical protein
LTHKRGYSTITSSESKFLSKKIVFYSYRYYFRLVKVLGDDNG